MSSKKIFLWFSLFLVGVILIWFRNEILSFIVQQVTDYVLEGIIIVLLRYSPEFFILLGGVETVRGLYMSQLKEVKIEIPDGLQQIPPSPNDALEPNLPDFLPIDPPPTTDVDPPFEPPQETNRMAVQEYLDKIASENNGIDGCIVFSATNGAPLYWSTVEGHGKWRLNSDVFSSRLSDVALEIKKNFSGQEKVLNLPVEFKYAVLIFDKLGLYIHADDRYVIVFANGQGIKSLGKLVEFAPDYIPKIKDEINRLR